MALPQTATPEFVPPVRDFLTPLVYVVCAALSVMLGLRIVGVMDQLLASPLQSAIAVAGFIGWLSLMIVRGPTLTVSLLNPFLAFGSLWLLIELARRGIDMPLGGIVVLGCLALSLWKWKDLYSSWANVFLTLACFMLLILGLPPLVNWGLVNAVWRPDAEACRAVIGVGACWGFVAEKLRLIIFGTYPFAEQWRPLVMMLVLLGLIGISMNREFWRPWLGLAWAIGVVTMGVLMWGGILGMPFVETEKWGGLPLTLLLATNGIVFSFPIAIALALGRRSDLPVIKALCIGFIELVRGVPLITVLFMASLMLPLFLPEGMTINKLLRAQVGIILFTAAYVAEVIRGGLQAIPKGQFEAADSLGLGYWQKTGFIVLPQALRLVIPPMVNSFISMLKDTSLVIIIGLFDLLGSARMASNDPQWRVFYIEGLIFIALIYFVLCYTIARYSRYVETLARTGEKR